MNQKYFILKTLRSSARFTETERSRATFTFLPFILTLLLVSPCFAWDDDDDTDHGYKNAYQSKIQNPQSRITPTSSIDYGYKNTYQANPSHRTSAIDFGGPKRLAQEDDYTAPKRLISPQQQYEADRASSIRVPSVQESIALRDRASRELMAESQRHFEKQEAQQERNHAQMAKQQAIYDEMDQEECEMAEFIGGVFKAKFGATTGRNSAITSEGYIFRSGDNFITPRGIYSKDRDIYAGPDGITTQTGNLFFGNNGTTIQAGGAYFTDGRSGYVVGPNCRNTSTWRSR